MSKNWFWIFAVSALACQPDKRPATPDGRDFTSGGNDILTDGTAGGPLDTGTTAAVIDTDTTGTDTGDLPGESVGNGMDDTGNNGGDTGNNGGGGGTEVPPANVQDMQPWLAARTYGAWKAEPGAHPTSGPHVSATDNVRVFMNNQLAASLEAGNDLHPIGSAAVKEISNGNAQLLGWAVAVRTESTGAGQGWYWYEYFQNSVLVADQGDPNCSGCHDEFGQGSIISPYPF